MSIALPEEDPEQARDCDGGDPVTVLLQNAFNLVGCKQSASREQWWRKGQIVACHTARSRVLDAASVRIHDLIEGQKSSQPKRLCGAPCVVLSVAVISSEQIPPWSSHSSRHCGPLQRRDRH